MNAHRLHTASKRRRVVFQEKMILIAVAAFLALFVSICAGTRLVKAQDEESQKSVLYKYYKSIEISAGDTLWKIAEDYADNGMSTKDYIQELKAMNHLTTDEIHEGQYLTVAYYESEYK